MTVVSLKQAKAYAQSAGFKGLGLLQVLAIAMAESGLKSDVSNTNSDGSIDRGILQINSRWHPEVSDNCAYNPKCAFSAAFRISNKGNSFTPWATFNSGDYKRYTSQIGVLVPETEVNKQEGTPWYDFAKGHGYITSYQGPGTDTPHYAIDMQTPFHTKLTSLYGGRVVTADYQPWGGQVEIEAEVPGKGTLYETFVHLDEISVKVGDHLTAGQYIGLSGGENPGYPGAEHPATSKWSSGPHTHYGFDQTWLHDPGGVHIDPSFAINYARSTGNGLDWGAMGNGASVVGGGASGDFGNSQGNQQGPIANNILSKYNDAYLALSDRAHETLAHVPGFYGMVQALDEVEQFPGIITYGDGDLNPLDVPGNAIKSVFSTVIGNTMPLFVRGSLIAVGFLMIVAVIFSLAQKSGAVDAAEKAIPLALAAV